MFILPIQCFAKPATVPVEMWHALVCWRPKTLILEALGLHFGVCALHLSTFWSSEVALGTLWGPFLDKCEIWIQNRAKLESMLASIFATWVPMLAPKQCSVLESFSRRHFRGSRGAFWKKKVAIRLPLGRQSVCFIHTKNAFCEGPHFCQK